MPPRVNHLEQPPQPEQGGDHNAKSDQGLHGHDCASGIALSSDQRQRDRHRRDLRVSPGRAQPLPDVGLNAVAEDRVDSRPDAVQRGPGQFVRVRGLVIPGVYGKVRRDVAGLADVHDVSRRDDGSRKLRIQRT